MISQISDVAAVGKSDPAQNRAQSPATPAAEADPKTDVSPDQRVKLIQATVEKLIAKSLPSKFKLEIDRDGETGTFIYRSIDPDTGEVVRQWPSEDIIKLRDALGDMEGMLVDKTA